jgi:FtsZ-interacting cell division protein ZipA
MDYRIIISVILLLTLILHTIFRNKKENFTDNLDKLDSMNDKLDALVDQETETRTFCKLLRHDSNYQEPLEKIMKHRNQQFQNNWKKQNKMLADIKKKIIGIKLGNDSQEFSKFNTDRNKQRHEFNKRKQIIQDAKNLITSKPQINVKFQ